MQDTFIRKASLPLWSSLPGRGMKFAPNRSGFLSTSNPTLPPSRYPTILTPPMASDRIQPQSTANSPAARPSSIGGGGWSLLLLVAMALHLPALNAAAIATRGSVFDLTPFRLVAQPIVLRHAHLSRRQSEVPAAAQSADFRRATFNATDNLRSAALSHPNLSPPGWSLIDLPPPVRSI